MVKVYRDGTKATTKIGGIEGLTTAVLIRSGRVQYEFSYFHDGEHKDIWIEEYELDFGDQKPGTQIGYEINTSNAAPYLKCDTCGNCTEDVINTGCICYMVIPHEDKCMGKLMLTQ